MTNFNNIILEGKEKERSREYIRNSVYIILSFFCVLIYTYIDYTFEINESWVVVVSVSGGATGWSLMNIIELKRKSKWNM